MKKRDINVDFIRVMACFIVICVHIDAMSMSGVDRTKVLWTVLFGDGVAFFFMLMGFFMFNNDSFLKLLKKTTLHILLPAFIVMFLSRMFYYWIVGQSGFFHCFTFEGFDWKDMVACLLNWTTGGYNCQHLWYIFTYFQVILLFPILKLLCPGIKHPEDSKKTVRIRWYLMLMTLFGLLINDVQAYFQLPMTVMSYIPIAVPAVYSVTGYTIYENKEKIQHNRWIPIAFGALAVVMEIIRYLLQIKLYEKDVSANYYLFWNIGLAYVVTASVIVVIMAIPFRDGRTGKWISYLGSLTFAIYLLHYNVIAFLDSRGLTLWVSRLMGCEPEEVPMCTFKQELIYIGVKFLAVFGITLVLSVLIDMIKRGLRKWKRSQF